LFIGKSDPPSYMKKFWGSFSVVSGATMCSRVLGLIRDILFFATFGASMFGEAFLLAFTLPNLFRRMLGEGTLSSAFVPVFSSSWHESGISRAWNLLNQIISRMFLYLGGFALIICLISWLLSYFFHTAPLKWVYAFKLNGIIFCYLVMICTSAILVGAQNVKGRFFEGAISPVVLNVCMILSLLISPIFANNDKGFHAFMLGGSVVIAGLIQLWFPWRALRKNESWKWKFDLSCSEDVNAVKSLFWVGALGATVAQLNLLISRFLAYSLDETGGLSFLYMAARLVELPLGVFAIAISTVLFPKLAQASSKKDERSYQKSFFIGMKLIGAITLPASVGLFVLADPIIRLLFEWNAFGPEQTKKAVDVLRIAAWTIPFYALSTFLVKAFHSEKDMKRPLHAAVVSLIVNFLLSLILMNKYGVLGLAWANLISAFCQMLFLCSKKNGLQVTDWFKPTKISILAPILGCVGIYLLLINILPYFPSLSGKLSDFFVVATLVPSAILSYILLLKFQGFSWSATSRTHKDS
jgi:putative peptidoglycan lipid II flippase